jgi:DNA-binding SARP family transcriptional activator/tetratricopeptide (TPR) repeat protein
MLRAGLFGEFTVHVGDSPVRVGGLRPRSVLAHLLLHPGPHPRTRLAGTFWPDVLETSARASLRSALWTIRAALDEAGGGDYLDAGRTHVAIAPDLPRDVDVERFERLRASDDAGEIALAVDLGTAPLLADLPDEWVLEEREGIRARVLQAVGELASRARHRGDAAEAARWSRRAVALDRLSERRHEDLIRDLDAAGEHAGALAAYVDLRRTLRTELGIEPSPQTRRLVAVIRGEAARNATVAMPDPVAAARRAPVLRGRDVEAGELAAAWDDALAGDGALIVVTGEAGIGKTALVDDLADRATGDGATLARGAAVAIDGSPPLAPWSEVVRALVAAGPAPPRSSWAGDLARLCPAVESQWGVAPAAAPGIPETERARVFDAVAELLVRRSEERPVIVILEDLHWTDAPSAALLAHVARRAGDARLLVAVTRRPVPATPALDAAVDAVRRGATATRELGVGPLAPDAVAAVVRAAAADLSDADAARVVAAADGNPLLARQAALAAAAGADPSEGLRATARAALAATPDGTRPLLHALAAATRPVTFAEAACLVADGDPHAAIGATVDTGLVSAGPDQRVGFTHDLIREACMAEIPPAQRAAAHAAVAAALSRQPGRQAAEVARHHRLAGQDAAARRYLTVAGADAIAVGAVDEAAAFLEEAVTLAAADDAEAAEAWMALAEAHSWRADRGASDRAFARAAAAWEARGDTAALGAAHAARSRWLHTTMCFPSEALGAGRTALSLLDRAREAAPEARVLALASTAWAEAVAGDPAAAEPMARAAAAAPEAAHDRMLASELEHARATALIRSGRLAEAAVAASGAARLARDASRPDAAALATLTAACALACLGDVDEALALCARSREAGWPGRSLDLQLRAAEAHALSRLDRHDEAEAAARRNVSVARRDGSLRDEATAWFDLGTVLLAAGDGEEAARALRTAAADATGAVPRATALLLLGEALAAAGDPEGAAAALDRVPFAPVTAADMPDTLPARLARLEALVARARGDEALAARRFDEAEAAWERLRDRTDRGDAFAASLVDLGRPPVAGLVEPEREIERIRHERTARAHATEGEPDAGLRAS